MAKVMIELGVSGGIDALPAVREPIPVIRGSVDDAILLAFAKNTPVAVITDERPANRPSATETRDERRVLFQNERQRELQALMGNG